LRHANAAHSSNGRAELEDPPLFRLTAKSSSRYVDTRRANPLQSKHPGQASKLRQGVQERFMKSLPFIFMALTVSGAGAPPPDPVRAVTAEPGVVPSGTQLVVRTSDTVRTRKALRGTIYGATVAEDILDQNGTVLIPTGSPVELAVRSLPYLGPGGVGMTDLMLEVRAVTVNGFRYPVETRSETPGAGGIGLDREAAQWVDGDTTASAVVTAGRRINVPVDSLLAFRIDDPIRLTGFRR
jgi:hypothetical protein